MGCNGLYTIRNSKKLDSSFNTQRRQVSGFLTDIYTCRGAKNSREKHGGGEKQRMAAGGKSGVEGSALRQDSNQWKMGRLSFSSGKTCSESGIPYLSFNRKIKCCWGNTSHVNFWTFGHLYFWKYTITLHSYGYNFTSLYKYATKNANLTVQQTSIKHLCFLIWNEKPRVSLLMNTFFLKGWTRTAAQGGKLSLDLHPADEYTHQHTSYAWKDRINPARVTP